MAESSSISNKNAIADPSRTKRRKIGVDSTAGGADDSCGTRWRTEAEQKIYSSKLVDALSRLPRPESARAVRVAADRVLAVSAKGNTRWSRAILTGRLSIRLAQINKKHRRAARPGLKNKTVPLPPPLQRKVRVLSRLVPGCRNLSLPSLLEETTDYIAALEMQVKAMTFITGLLNGGGTVG